MGVVEVIDMVYVGMLGRVGLGRILGGVFFWGVGRECAGYGV